MIKRNLIANYLGSGWSALMGLAFVPLYIKYLGIEAYGLIGLFAVLTAWLSLLDMGMTPTLGREIARLSAGAHTPQSIRDLLRSLEIIVFSFALVIAGGVWIGADWLASNWLRPERLPVSAVARALSMMALVVSLRFCEGIYRSGIIGLQQQVWFNAANATLQTLRYAGAVVVLGYVSGTIEAFFLWQAGISLLTLGIFKNRLHRKLPVAPKSSSFSRKAIRDIGQFAGGMLCINILVLLLTQVDKMLLSNLLSLQHYGYYMLAGAIAGIVPIVISPITQSLYPRLVELHASGDEAALARLFHQGAQLVTFVTTPLMLILSVFPEAVLYVWSGDSQLATNTAPILTPLVVGSFLNGLMWMPYQTQLAHGWTSLTIKVNAFAVAILVPAIFLVVPIYGAVGAAWIWVVLNSAYVIISAQLMYRKILINEKWLWYCHDLISQITAGLVVVGFFYFFIKMPLEATRLQWLLYLLLVGLFSALIVLLASRLLRAKARVLMAHLLTISHLTDKKT